MGNKSSKNLIYLMIFLGVAQFMRFFSQQIGVASGKTVIEPWILGI